MGLMARHIAYSGAHPIFFYGQNYMGATEAYLGALFFHLFGPSLLTLRLSVIALTALFLLSTYLLASRLYSRGFALFTLALLGLGSNAVFLLEVYARGGSTQTMAFGSLSFLLATLLGLSYRPDAAPRLRWLRSAGYSGYGAVIGLGVWSDWVVLPFFALSFVLLLWFCWRDWRSLEPLFLLLGLAAGAFPLISYNLGVPFSQNSLITLLQLFHGSHVQQARTLAQLWQGIRATVQLSLPAATGDPSCPIPAVNYASDMSEQSTACLALHSVWGIGYLALWLLSTILTVRAFWRLRGQIVERERLVLLGARLCLLAAVGLVVGAYAVSSAPLGMPESHYRYLCGLLIATPAIIWPLWEGLTTLPFAKTRLAVISSAALLSVVAASFLLGTILTFGDVPSARAADQSQAILITGLLDRGISHIYTDYWTCDRVAFVSQERITCGVLDDSLQPSHNRVPGYYAQVSADPAAAYVFAAGSGALHTLEQRVQASNTAFEYRIFEIAGYVVYAPLPPAR